MGYVVRMPQLGMSMEEGTVVEWTVAQGEKVVTDQIVAIVESEKTTAEVEAREDGFLRQIIVSEGQTVEPGDPIGIVASPDDDISELEQIAKASGSEDGSDLTEATSSQTSRTPDQSVNTDVKATPGARKLARDSDISLSGIEGTGPQGVVTEDDVSEALSVQTEIPSDADKSHTVVKASQLSGMQQTISERLHNSYREAVHVTLDRSYSTDILTATIDAARTRGVSISVEDVLLKAVASSLNTHQQFNANLKNGEYLLIEEVHIGVAIDIDRGLVAPVIANVDSRSIEDIHTTRTSLVDHVRADDFTMDDLSNGTFTISNLGQFGIDRFDPIINPPQVAILGIGQIKNSGTMTLSLSFDHRVVNGADAARFLETIVDTLTDPEQLIRFFETELSTTDILSVKSPNTMQSARTEETRQITVESPSGFHGSYEIEGISGHVSFDEPTNMGGNGLAASPIEHLLGALGSCLSLATRSMANRDEVDVGSITCAVAGSPTEGPLESISVEVIVDSLADEDALEQVLLKAERACYVERALSDDIDVDISWSRDRG